MKALLALEDGRVFKCQSFTGPGEVGGEVVFNTGMTGYQEVLTDPSYFGQLVTMTYPLIGNYGTNAEDAESDKIQVSAFLVKEYQKYPSNFRSSSDLVTYLRSQKILGIEQIDTRALTRHIRKQGAMRAFVSTQDTDPVSCIRRANAIPSIAGQDFVKKVTTTHPYYWRNGKKVLFEKGIAFLDSNVWELKTSAKSVVVFDFGIKYNILRCLEHSGFEVVVVPATCPADIVKAMEPDGIFLSNGPGDPEPVTYAVDTIRTLLGYRPIFGICLGLQLLGLASYGQTFKLKFGHHGVNQPVKNLSTKRIEITSQNHGFALDPDSLNKEDIIITYINLNDNTVEGFSHRKYPAFAVQFHPEASPGPNDVKYLFNEFAQMMNKYS